MSQPTWAWSASSFSCFSASSYSFSARTVSILVARRTASWRTSSSFSRGLKRSWMRDFWTRTKHSHLHITDPGLGSSQSEKQETGTALHENFHHRGASNRQHSTQQNSVTRLFRTERSNTGCLILHYKHVPIRHVDRASLAFRSYIVYGYKVVSRFGLAVRR